VTVVVETVERSRLRILEYSQVSKDLLQELGVEVSRFYKIMTKNCTTSWATPASLIERLLAKTRLVPGMDRRRGLGILAKTRSPRGQSARDLRG